MNAALIGQVGLLLAGLGGALQFARAFKDFPEWLYYVAVAIVTALGCWLAVSGPVTDWKAFILTNWPVYSTLYGVTMGGTKAASDSAKAGFVLIPQTNSKG